MLAGIFVGGAASRMGGAPKGLLRLPTGETLVERLRDLLAPVATRVVLVGQHPAYATLGMEVIPDEGAARGPLSGLLALLRAAGQTPALAIACDMPAVTSALLARLASHAPDAAAVAARIDDRWQPFFARYAPSTLAVAERHAAAGILSLQALLDAAGATPLPLDDDERRLLDDCDDWPAASRAGLRPYDF